MKVEQKVAKVLSEGYLALAGRLDRAGTQGPSVGEYTDLTKRAKSLNVLVSLWLEGVDLGANTVSLCCDGIRKWSPYCRSSGPAVKILLRGLHGASSRDFD